MKPEYSYSHWVLLVLGLWCALAPSPARAQEIRVQDNGGHYRGASLSWQRLQGNEIELVILSSWRRNFTSSYFSGKGSDGFAVKGDEIVLNGRQWPSVQWGDGQQDNYIKVRVQAHSVQGNWLHGRSVLRHTFATPNNAGQAWVVKFTGCCRLASLNKDLTADAPWELKSSVDLLQSEASPVPGIPLDVYVPIKPSAQQSYAVSFSLPAVERATAAPSTMSLLSLGQRTGVAGQLNITLQSNGLLSVSVPAALPVPDVLQDSLYVLIRATSASGSFCDMDLQINIIREAVSATVPMALQPQGSAAVYPSATAINVWPGNVVQFTVRATDAEASHLLGFDLPGLPSDSSVSSPRRDGNGNWVADVQWNVCTADIGPVQVCSIVRDNAGGVSLPQCMMWLVLESPAPAFVPSMSPNSTALYMNKDNRVKFIIRDANCQSQHTVELQGQPEGMRAEIRHLDANHAIGCGAEVSVLYRPSYTSGGEQNRVCITVKEICGACNCANGDTSVQHCFDASVPKCMSYVRQDTTLGRVGTAVGTDWLRMWEFNPSVLHPDHLVPHDTLLHTGRLVYAPKGSTVQELSGHYGMSTTHFANLNRDIATQASFRFTGEELVCVVPDSCQAKLQRAKASSGYRDQEWFKQVQTDRNVITNNN